MSYNGPRNTKKHVPEVYICISFLTVVHQPIKQSLYIICIPTKNLIKKNFKIFYNVNGEAGP